MWYLLNINLPLTCHNTIEITSSAKLLYSFQLSLLINKFQNIKPRHKSWLLYLFMIDDSGDKLRSSIAHVPSQLV